jgi:hypothetical protein
MALNLGKKTPPVPPHTGLASILATLNDLRAQDDDLRNEELKRMAAGEKIEPEEIVSIKAQREAAEKLLRGESPIKQARRTFRSLLEQRETIRLAINLAQEKFERARLEAAGDRFTERQSDIARVAQRMVAALFELDRAMRERDLLVHEIGLPPAAIPFEAWPLCGRLGNTGSQIYRFVEMCVNNGWITQGTLAKEFDEARKADFWR